MVITIIEGGELSKILARILLLFNHKINVMKYKVEADNYKFNEPGVNFILGDETNTDILTQTCVSQSDVVISLMDEDFDNLLLCLFIRKHYHSTKIITKVNNPKYDMNYKKLGIDIAFDSVSVLSDLLESARKNSRD